MFETRSSPCRVALLQLFAVGPVLDLSTFEGKCQFLLSLAKAYVLVVAISSAVPALIDRQPMFSMLISESGRYAWHLTTTCAGHCKEDLHMSMGHVKILLMVWSERHVTFGASA
jgi:hypothetical protein